MGSEAGGGGAVEEPDGAPVPETPAAGASWRSGAVGEGAGDGGGLSSPLSQEPDRLGAVEGASPKADALRGAAWANGHRDGHLVVDAPAGGKPGNTEATCPSGPRPSMSMFERSGAVRPAGGRQSHPRRRSRPTPWRKWGGPWPGPRRPGPGTPPEPAARCGRPTPARRTARRPTRRRRATSPPPTGPRAGPNPRDSQPRRWRTGARVICGLLNNAFPGHVRQPGQQTRRRSRSRGRRLTRGPRSGAG